MGYGTMTALASLASPRLSANGGEVEAEIQNNDCSEPDQKLFGASSHGVSSGLTTRAQPRRAKRREPRSGTTTAPRRWLQRFVELSRCAAGEIGRPGGHG